MLKQVQYGFTTITYHLTRSKRRTVGITVKPDGQVYVSAPLKLPAEKINEIINSKSRWINSKRQRFEELGSDVAELDYISGEKVLFLGKLYTLDVFQGQAGKNCVSLTDDKIKIGIKEVELGADRRECVREALKKWYRAEAGAKFEERIKYYAGITGLYPVKVNIKEQKTRWGSCTVRNVLNLNWKVIMAPEPVLDYLVVHELCHIAVKNHSGGFWDMVGSILPGYREWRKWLKENGTKLNV